MATQVQTDLAAFRSQTREWLLQNCPEEMRAPIKDEKDVYWGGRNGSFKNEAQQKWFEAMASKGWTAPRWPAYLGGGGLSKDEAVILAEEMAKLGCRQPMHSFGIWMLGPALLKFGNEEQKKAYIPDIVNGKIRWCQGYSEPNAGSDLANLQTKAEDKGDHYLVNGQKVWTSYADKSDWIFCLVRTNSEGTKHQGISFLLIDMASEGVTTSPIKLISGKSPFCETFFDNVKVPKENLVGQLDKGWSIAKYLLTHERSMIGGLENASEGPDLAGFAKEHVPLVGGKLADAGLRQEVTRIEINQMAFNLTKARIMAEAEAGFEPGAKSSFLKFYSSELNKDRYEAMVALAGLEGLEWEGENAKLPSAWLRTKANSIEGGTSEVQLNIISKHILGLPMLK